jgi:tmRNA-binding protein
MPTLLAYASDKKASQAVIDAAKKAAAMLATMNATAARIALLGQERQSIDADQNRIRQNMASIDHDTEVYRRYLTKFNEQESRLEAILVQTTNEQSTLQSQQDALNDYVRSLNVS